MSQEPPEGRGVKDGAEGRTELAGDRTLLANERTLAAWWRTAMGAVAAAIAFTKLYADVEPQVLVKGGATFLIALAFVILLVALRRYRRTARQVEAGSVDRVSSNALTAGTALLMLAATAAATAIWLL